MSDTKTKKKPRNTKIYPVREILEKYNLTPPEFQELAQSVLKPSHMTSKGLTITGLMMIGKAVKKLQKGAESKHKEAQGKIKDAKADAPDIRYLEVSRCAKPPNKLRLWCIDWVEVEGEPALGERAMVIVTRKIHDGAKAGTSLRCKHLGEDLFLHSPIEGE